MGRKMIRTSHLLIAVLSAYAAAHGFAALACIDPDLTKLKKGAKIMLCDGTLAEGQYEAPALCTKNGQTDCLNKNNFKALDTTTMTAADIKMGQTVAGIVGTKRKIKQCRNAAYLAFHDATYPPSNLTRMIAGPSWNSGTTDIIDLSIEHGLTNNAPVRFSATGSTPAEVTIGTTYYATVISSTEIRISATVGGPLIDFSSGGTVNQIVHDAGDGVASDFDTIDDLNELNTNPAPKAGPWGSDYVCSEDNFVNVSTEVIPSGATPTFGNKPFTQVWRDELTGLLLTNILYDGTGTTTWAEAIRLCRAVDSAGAGTGWRLPTQREMMQLYIDGSAKIPIAGGDMHAWIWGSTKMGTYRWTGNLATGNTGILDPWDTTASVICVR